MPNYRVTETRNYEVGLSLDGTRGYFEHRAVGEDLGGELLFKDGALIDYDGVFSLPREIAVELKDRGVDVSYVSDEYEDHTLKSKVAQILVEYANKEYGEVICEHLINTVLEHKEEKI